MREFFPRVERRGRQFQKTECPGLDRVLKGWAKAGLSDEELRARGGQCFDALYQYLSK